MLRVKRLPPVFILVGNKADRSYEREVSREEGEDLARVFGCEFIEASAKTGKCVDDMFFNLVRKLRVYRPARGVVEVQKPRGCTVM
jgi:GTPase KRas protein